MDATDLAYAGAEMQARAVRDRSVSAREVVEATLARIDALDRQLNAYRVVFAERALADADEIDAHHAPADDRRLLGVPVAIKDDADVAGEVTAWGSDAYGDPKRVDSDVVTKLRASGAIVIGKTHVPELTLWPWTASVNWGATHNPWDTSRTPGGSSGGSAAAVASGMCGIALGSDGGGSIRYPSALTGVFGIKPQRDRISLGPDHRDAWNGLIAYGPLARTVRDAAVFLDAVSTEAPTGGFRAALDTPPEPLRIAISFAPPLGSLARLTDERRAAIDETAAILRSLGHHVFEREVDYGVDALLNVTVRYLTAVHCDAAAMASPERLERNTRQLAALGSLVPDSLVRDARRKASTIAARINRLFDEADVVITPMLGGPPPSIADVTGRGVVRSLYRSFNEVAWAAPWNAIGQPAASVPAGFDAHGLPVAVQLCGRRGDEATLFRIAAQLEAVRPWADRRPPVDEPESHGGGVG
jgi:amidase